MQPNPDAPLCLCIELDADFFYLVRSYAERGGLRAEPVSRGTDAVDQAKMTKPAVIFLEIDRPTQQRSWDVLAALKSEQAVKDIPVVVFSWLEEEEVAIQKGADVFVRKPVMFSDFLDVLISFGLCTGANSNEIFIKKEVSRKNN
jgi:CheY-like chemotaxis protein